MWMRRLLLTVTHLLALGTGFAAGIYALPLLTAPAAPGTEAITRASAASTYRGQFRRDLKDSDALHWGEGEVSLGPQGIALAGRLAPGPDYKLYLSPVFVETEADFERIKPQMLRVGDVKTFENFIVPLPDGVDLARYDTVVVWCESFSQFITAAKYR
ncbi:DM13 domain-containing protein [Uliginosibacterium sp. H1]|uniref:DM13 domain-containing protein n=1 Tax=Uliginosibacterium sp. H1 TaxID=3114757 RepID=UPI002E19D669|nr:DM13 domain-containing protein [Uliginosibacterium sp. H1]